MTRVWAHNRPLEDLTRPWQWDPGAPWPSCQVCGTEGCGDHVEEVAEMNAAREDLERQLEAAGIEVDLWAL